jgi:ribosomal protein L29
MQVQAQTEPLLNDYVAWHGDFSDKKTSVIQIMRRNSRAILASVAGLSAVLILAYCATKNSSEANASSPSSPSIEKVSQPIVRSSSEMESLRAAISVQNATNQQLVTTIDALRAEQQEMRKQIAAMQASRQPAGITGSINPQPQTKASATKRVDQGDARLVPYPPAARQVPYPRVN